MRRAVVVERDRNRKSLTAPSPPSLGLKLRGCHDPVATHEKSHLGGEALDRHGRHQLPRWVTILAVDSVIEEHQAGSPRRKACEEREQKGDRGR
jgi:hypothetical protein